MHLFLSCLMIFATNLSLVQDKDTKATTFEFSDTAPKLKYSMRISLEFGSGPRPYVVRIKGDAGGTGADQAMTFAAILDGAGGWKFTRDGAKVMVTGWNDPKTGVFHPLKEVKITTDNMPKDFLPKITRPEGKL